jgi:S1-C subfamily serine protease
VTGDALADRIAPSLVLVNFSMPYSVAGVTERNYHGTGLVVDAERGLVAVDRNTVPVAVGDVRLTFAGSVEVPGRVEYVHPLHNVAIVSFDRALLNGTPVRSAALDTAELVPGEAVTVVGLARDSRVRSIATTVASVDDVNFPLSRTLQFREANLEVATLVDGPADFDGVVVGRNGRIRALWSSFVVEGGREPSQVNRGMSVAVVQEAVEAVRDGRPLRSLEVEFDAVPMSQARKLGLPDAWVERLEAQGGAHRQVLSVARVVAGSPAAGSLREGDLLLAVDGRPVRRFREVELATQAPSVSLTIFRDGKEQSIDVGTVALAGQDIDRLLLWAGAVLHSPHRAMSAQRGIPPEGVFVAYFSYGSPATRYGLFAGRRIVEVDGRRVHRGRTRQAGPVGLAAEDDHLERHHRGDHPEARSPLLANRRAAPDARRLAARADRLSRRPPAVWYRGDRVAAIGSRPDLSARHPDISPFRKDVGSLLQLG